MKKFFLGLSIIMASSTAHACLSCNKKLQNEIYNSTFYPNLLTMLSAFIAIAVVVLILVALFARRHRLRLQAGPSISILSPVPLTTAAIVLGIGLGGFLDGIVLHQIFQWHEMLSNKIPTTDFIGKSVNMFWDGIFHAFCLLVVLIGVLMLWKLLHRKDVNKSGKLLGGGMLMGWGIFNIVEGIIDHQILKLHNVIEVAIDHNIGNYAFLGGSIIMLIIGYAFVHHASKVVKVAKANGTEAS
jgi:uncharacterized membrane protein